MADKKHLKKLLQGVEVWNQWRKENIKITPDLSGANVGGADFRWTNLIKIILFGVKMNTYPFNIDLKGANLSEANPSKANLSTAFTQSGLID
jgi:uncharacterized protein YjbI with pentapeptide repeats